MQVSLTSGKTNIMRADNASVSSLREYLNVKQMIGRTSTNSYIGERGVFYTMLACFFYTNISYYIGSIITLLSSMSGQNNSYDNSMVSMFFPVDSKVFFIVVCFA